MVLQEPVVAYRFGRFVLEPDRRVLRLDGAEVNVGARAFDILLMLVRHRDRVVTKDEILAAVWNGRFVEENNLAVHVSALRRALGEKAGGDRFIATVSGVGYRFVRTVEETGRPLEKPETQARAPDDILPPATVGAPSPEGRPRAWVRRLAMAGFLMLPVLAALLWWGVIRQGADDTVAPLSIAVVPFRDLDGAHASLADAVTDDLTADLSFVPGSVVIARDSTEMFRERGSNTSEIGQALRVRYLLEGSLLADGSRLHVVTELVEARTGHQLWTSIFDIDREDVADRLREVVEHVSSVLRVTLVATAVEAGVRAHADPDALDLLWQARSVLDRRNDYGAYVDAQALLERAVAIAPQDRDVLSELGVVLVHKIGDFDDPNEVADHDRAVFATRQALGIAPDYPPALTAAGLLAWLDYRCGEAQTSLRSALSEDPNDLEARNGIALCARDTGDIPEMIAQEREILRIDPVGSMTAPIENSLGMGYLLQGKPSEAATWLLASKAASPAQPGSGQSWQEWRELFLIASLQMEGQSARARALFKRFDAAWPYRTRFQLAQLFSRPLSKNPGLQKFFDALGAAGMPDFPDPDIDCGVSAASEPQLRGDYAPTPTSIPGGARIDTAAVHRLLSGPTPPLVLDFSAGSSVIPQAVWISPSEWSGDLLATLRSKPGVGPLSTDRVIITMGYSAFGWNSYDAAVSLIRHGFHHVLWYRGGEADWKKSGFTMEDRRVL